jgi:taurine dioxygenase
MFGTPFIHPFLDAVEAHPAILEVVKEPDDTEPFGGEHWHADITFRNPPSSVSLLYSLDVPTMGGDTLFANQYLAYQALSSGLQRMVGDLEAVHAYPEMDENDDQASAVHPVVRIHPLTGRKALFVNPAFVTRFVDMTPAESKPLLDYLYRQSTRPEFQLRISWTVNQLVVWDNRAVIHYAMNDYPGRRRVLRRVTAMERS